MDKNKKLIEFFAGSMSIGIVAKRKGMEVFSSDIKQFGGIDYVVDILAFDVTKVPFVPDVGWFSPPCEGYSVAAIGKNWTGGFRSYIPKTETAKMGIRIVKKTIELIEYFISINPEFIFFIENPRGLLRKMDFMQGFKRHTVTYCQYGDERMKPTDIWTNSKTWIPRSMCKNGDSCHVAAPRGSKTGTQGRKGAYERSKIPEALCVEILNSLNHESNISKT